MHGQCNPVLDSHFAHQFRYVGLDGAFFNAERRADFFIRTACDQHLKNFFFTVGESDAARREDSARRSAHALDERRQHPPKPSLDARCEEPG